MCHLRDHQHHFFWFFFSRFYHAVCPIGRQVLVQYIQRDLGGEPAHIFYKCQPQHNGNCPKLSYLQGSNRLVCAYKPGKAFKIHPPVAMRYQLNHYIIYPWQPFRRAVAQLRQPFTISFWQMLFACKYLLFYQVKIIQQPFPGRINGISFLHLFCEQAVHFHQYPLIISQPFQHPFRRFCPGKNMTAGKRTRMLLHLLKRKKLRTQRLFLGPVFFKKIFGEKRYDKIFF